MIKVPTYIFNTLRSSNLFISIFNYKFFITLMPFLHSSMFCTILYSYAIRVNVRFNLNVVPYEI